MDLYVSLCIWDHRQCPDSSPRDVLYKEWVLLYCVDVGVQGCTGMESCMYGFCTALSGAQVYDGQILCTMTLYGLHTALSEDRGTTCVIFFIALSECLG